MKMPELYEVFEMQDEVCMAVTPNQLDMFNLLPICGCGDYRALIGVYHTLLTTIEKTECPHSVGIPPLAAEMGLNSLGVVGLIEHNPDTFEWVISSDGMMLLVMLDQLAEHNYSPQPAVVVKLWNEN